MKDIIWAVVILVIALGVSAWYKASQKSKGNIIDRAKDFAEYAEIFTLKPITDEEFMAAIKKANFPAVNNTKVSRAESGAIYLEVGSYFKSKITPKEKTEDKSVYRYEFISWSSKHGKPEHDIEMNRQMTSVEKMFLDLDPNTQVATVKNEIKTKRDLF